MKFIKKIVGVSLVSLMLINISIANNDEGVQSNTINESTQAHSEENSQSNTTSTNKSAEKTADKADKKQRDYILPFKKDRVEGRKDRRSDMKEAIS